MLSNVQHRVALRPRVQSEGFTRRPQGPAAPSAGFHTRNQGAQQYRAQGLHLDIGYGRADTGCTPGPRVQQVWSAGSTLGSRAQQYGAHSALWAPGYGVQGSHSAPSCSGQGPREDLGYNFAEQSSAGHRVYTEGGCSSAERRSLHWTRGAADRFQGADTHLAAMLFTSSSKMHCPRTSRSRDLRGSPLEKQVLRPGPQPKPAELPPPSDDSEALQNMRRNLLHTSVFQL